MTQGGRKFDRSPEVIALLRSHGSSVQTARTVAWLGEALRERSTLSEVEVAALVDAATGAQVSSILVGEIDHTDLRPHMDALQAGRRYVHIHTHPGSSTFSADDLALLLAHPELRTLVVVGVDASWYFLSKVAGQPTADPREAVASWLTEFTALDPKYDSLIEDGVLYNAEATRHQADETIAAVAPQLRLRYDQLRQP